MTGSDNPVEKQYYDDLESEDIVLDIIRTIQFKVDVYIATDCLKKLDVPISVESAMLKLSKMTLWSTLFHDAVDSLEKLAYDEEPKPVQIDSWARGTGFEIFHLFFTFLTKILCYSKKSKTCEY
jgi:hypothetical protein